MAKIPSDAILLASGRIADLWNSDVNKSVRQKLAKEMKEGAREFEKKFGLPLDQVERMTLVIMDAPPSREDPLLFVRTTKPYDRGQAGRPRQGRPAEEVPGRSPLRRRQGLDRSIRSIPNPWSTAPLRRSTV